MLLAERQGALGRIAAPADRGAANDAPALRSDLRVLSAGEFSGSDAARGAGIETFFVFEGTPRTANHRFGNLGHWGGLDGRISQEVCGLQAPQLPMPGMEKGVSPVTHPFLHPDRRPSGQGAT
jgi:hypothetical protein